MPEDQAARMEAIAEAIQNLHESPLYEYRTENNYKPVIGEGSLDAKIMFIGEAPGENEAKSGRPFVGAAGRVLAELLGLVGLKREDVYITNIVKDRPPKNRDPKPEEIELYKPYLAQQIDIIRPRVIVTLGRFSMGFIFELFGMPQQGGKISDLHGQALEADTPYGQIAIVPLYHPAVGFYNKSQQETLREDIMTLALFV